MGILSYRCSATTRSCECAVKKPVVENTTTVIDGTEWRGDSFCDKIMRGYHNKKVTTPVEKAWTERCINLRTVGQTILNALGFQSVPPDIAYNPRRPIQLLFEIVEGLYIYYFDGFVGDMRTSARAKAHYFDTLITKNIDPIMMFQILDLTSYAMEIVEDITGNMTVPDIVKELPEELQQALHVTWEEVQNQYNTTVSVTEQLAQFGRSMGKSIYFGSHITSALIEEIFSKRFQKSSNATYNATNTTALEENANILVSSVESPVPLR